MAVAYTLFSATAEKSSFVQLVLFKLVILLGISSVWLSYDRLCAYTGKMLRNKFPKVNSILTGGR